MKNFLSELIRSKPFIAQFVCGLLLLSAAIIHKSMIHDHTAYISAANLVIILFIVTLLLLIIKLPAMLILLFSKRWKQLAATAATGFMLLIFMIASMIIDAPTLIYAT